jgi:hypothetical protein
MANSGSRSDAAFFVFTPSQWPEPYIASLRTFERKHQPMNGPNLLERLLPWIDRCVRNDAREVASIKDSRGSPQLLAPGHLVYFKYKLYWGNS